MANSHYGLLSQSILNGVVGDYLAQTNNALAIQMGLYHRLKKLNLEMDLDGQLLDMAVTNKVVVLVHGLTNLETVWNFPDAASLSGDETPENYGTKLQKDFGYTPLFLRYNTGLPIEPNGHEFSEALEQLINHYPMQIDELVLVGFSMGGLLLRYAQKDGIETDKQWLKVLSKCMYIGTPHEGSPLEKFGHITGEIVRNIPLDYVNHWAEWIDIRSQGIKDLKLGMKTLPKTQSDNTCGSFYSGSKHYFVSGSVGKKDDSTSGKLFGDSLVRKGSAIPAAKPKDSQSASFENLAHVPLAHSQRVYDQIAQWLNEAPSQVALKRLSNRRAPSQKEQGSGHSDNYDPAMIAGAVDMLSVTAQKVIDTTETMHHSIADVSYDVLRNIPLVKEFAAPVESIHKGVSRFVFGSLKSGAKKPRQATKKS